MEVKGIQEILEDYGEYMRKRYCLRFESQLGLQAHPEDEDAYDEDFDESKDDVTADGAVQFTPFEY